MNASRAHGRKVSSTGTGILANRIGALEAKIAALSAEMERRTTSAEKDVESSLTVSEKKCKSLDELYREANAENEALYERFNEELGRVLRSVKAGHGGEEMKAKMQAAQDEAVRLRRENQRLKRENAGLRSQLRD
jgi:Skp family chaperone for outer membrane proteins